MAHNAGLSPEHFAPLPSGISAGAFNNLLEAFERVRVPLAAEEAHATAKRDREALKHLIEGHITDARWRNMLHAAREAAERGERQCLLLRFPSDTCSDSGRALAAEEPAWAATLTGDAAAIYHRWQTELAGRGFLLTARLLEYPGGKPGDAGLFLGWGA